jgi:hypothetical protein
VASAVRAGVRLVVRVVREVGPGLRAVGRRVAALAGAVTSDGGGRRCPHCAAPSVQCAGTEPFTVDTNVTTEEGRQRRKAIALQPNVAHRMDL